MPKPPTFLATLGPAENPNTTFLVQITSYSDTPGFFRTIDRNGTYYIMSKMSLKLVWFPIESQPDEFPMTI